MSNLLTINIRLVKSADKKKFPGLRQKLLAPIKMKIYISSSSSSIFPNDGKMTGKYCCNCGLFMGVISTISTQEYWEVGSITANTKPQNT